MRLIIAIVYLLIGLVVAANKDYLGDVNSLADIINMLLAILLWPLVLLGVDFNLDFGGGDKDDKDGDNKKGALALFGPVAVYARALCGSREESLPSA